MAESIEMALQVNDTHQSRERSTSILQLPNEILRLVANELEDSRDKLNLLLACRSLHARLHSAVYWAISPQGRELWSFLTHFFKYPDLGLLVRHFTNRQSNGGKMRCTTFSANIGRKLTDILHLIDLPLLPCAEWNSYWLYSHTSWIALLLPQLVGLKSLDMDLGRFCDIYVAQTLSQIAVQKKSLDDRRLSLQNLREVTIRTNYESLSSENYHSLLYLPALQILRAIGLWDIVPDDSTDRFTENCALHNANHRFAPPVKPPDGSSGIRELYFTQRCNSPRGFSTFITSCASLEIFEIQHFNWFPSHYQRNFYPSAFWNALLSQKNSLRVLRFNDKGDMAVARNESCIGSLRSFTRLEEVIIPLRLLLDVEVPARHTRTFAEILPSSLRCLFLGAVNATVFEVFKENLQGMLDVRRENFPELKTLVIEGRGLWNEEDTILMTDVLPDLLASEIEICKQEGIEMRFGRY